MKSLKSLPKFFYVRHVSKPPDSEIIKNDNDDNKDLTKLYRTLPFSCRLRTPMCCPPSDKQQRSAAIVWKYNCSRLDRGFHIYNTQATASTLHERPPFRVARCQQLQVSWGCREPEGARKGKE